MLHCQPRACNVSQSIEFFNRHRQCLEKEQVYGEAFLRFAYENPLGKIALHAFIKRPAFSRWYGHRMNQPASVAKIAPFLEKYHLNADEFEQAVSDYPHFNAFFYRKLKSEARPIDPSPATLVFPADGRHLGFARADRIKNVFIKGQRFDLKKLLGNDELANRFAGGCLVLSRLCPVDYHRFHFPVAGHASRAQWLDGPLFSVSPLALRRNLSYLWQNKRQLTQIDSPACGKVLMLEIGATCVGSINQTYNPDREVTKGEEKGFFAFGGSSTLTLFEPGRVTLAKDLLHHSELQRELYAHMGTAMATINPA